MHALDTGLVHRLLAGFDDPGRDLGLALPDDLLDPPRMDAAVGDQPLERQPADFAAYRVEAGDHDGVGRVVEDRKSTRLNSSHRTISYAVFCLKKKKKNR